MLIDTEKIVASKKDLEDKISELLGEFEKSGWQISGVHWHQDFVKDKFVNVINIEIWDGGRITIR